MEEWKIVVVNGEVYDNYMVSNMGNVMSLRDSNGNYREKILSPIKNEENYLRVNLRKKGRMKTCRIHRLVAEAFIPNDKNLPCIDHINTIRTDNRVCNLRWCTHKENSNNEITKKHYSESSKKRIVSEETKKKIRKALNKAVICIETNQVFSSTLEAEKELGIPQSSISRCCNKKIKSAGKLDGIKLHWEYLE